MQRVDFNGSRRRLLGSALILGAGATIATTASFPSIDVPLAAAGRRDLVDAELIRQLKEGVRAIRGPRPGEAARSVAGTLRLLASHYQATGVDADVQRRLRVAIARDGRDAVLRWEADAARRAADARAFGVADLALPREPFNLPERDRALQGMLRGGVTPALLAASADLTRLASLLDRVSVAPIAARQCAGTQGMAYSLDFVAVAACLVNPDLCAGIGGAYFGLKSSLWYFGC